MFLIKFPTLKMCLHRAAPLYSYPYCSKAPNICVALTASCFRDKLQFGKFDETVKYFDLTKIPFLKSLISTYRLIVVVLNDQNLFTESNLGDWCSSYVQFYSGGHFSE